MARRSNSSLPLSRENISYEELKKIFHLDKTTGKIFRLGGGNRTKCMPDGSVWLNGKKEGNHYTVVAEKFRINCLWISYVLHTGKKPPVDKWLAPINGRYDDYRFENIREIESVRRKSSQLSEDKIDLPQGVTLHRDKFLVQVNVKNKTYYVGTYETKEEASEMAEFVLKELKLFEKCTFVRNGKMITIPR